MSWTNWYLAIGWPNVSRSRAYSTQRSRHARITPHAPAATVKRPWSSPYMAISNPCPSSPTRFSAGTSTFSKKSSPVDPAQMPSLCSVSAVVKPGIPRSSMKAEMPLCFAAGSVFANTSAWSATLAYEIQFFEPLRMYPSPSRRAVDFIAATSDPAAGSVSPKHASFSPRACGASQRCFCSSLPYRSSASELSPTWTEISVRNAASPRSISSQASASATKSRPAPPYSSGTTIPSSPSSAIPSITDMSTRCSMSFSTAFGKTRSSTKSRTVSWISRCSSVRSKSMSESLWKRFAEIPLQIDAYELERLEQPVTRGFTRVTTVVHLHGAGAEGLGEDVTWYTEAHDRELAAGTTRPLVGSWTLASFSDVLRIDEPHKRWAYESAGLDLALRQAGKSLVEVVDREAKPVRFVVSPGLGEPPSAEPLQRRLELFPEVRFKLDAGDGWDGDLVGELEGSGRIDIVDFKAFYGEPGSEPALDLDLYRRVAEGFPSAWLEDPALRDGTEEILQPHLDRVTWDAPIHSVADVESLTYRPRTLNSKPSRFGRLQALLEFYDFCGANDISASGGGMFELGPGRGQIQYLASLFHPDAPNDVAPGGYNAPEPSPGLPPSPLPPPGQEPGFGLY